ncbi:MAG: acetolactate synthase small subunit [Candidatus Dormibacteraceae bacterium]
MSMPEVATAAPAVAVPATPAASAVRVLSVEVQDKPGVLFRVCGLIQRRGFNIQGLSVGRAETPGRSRMTLTVDAGHAEVDQVEKQLSRLIEVIAVEDLTEHPHLSRELALARLAVKGEQRRQAIDEVRGAGGSVVQAGPEEIVVEVSGEPEVIEGLRQRLARYAMVELARSGPIAVGLARR